MSRILSPFTAVVLVALTAIPALSAADLSGKWKLVWDTEGGIRHSEWAITQEGESLTVKTDGQTLKGTIDGERISLEGKFYSAEAGYSSTLKVNGTVSDGTLKGSGTWDQYGMAFTGTREE